jgi:hypothetical protein
VQVFVRRYGQLQCLFSQVNHPENYPFSIAVLNYVEITGYTGRFVDFCTEWCTNS